MISTGSSDFPATHKFLSTVGDGCELDEGTGAAVTVTFDVPVFPPETAATVNGPPTAEAENNPLASMLPPPETLQTNVGVDESAPPH